MEKSDLSQRVGSFKECSVSSSKRYKAYIPNALPPEPPLDMGRLYQLLDRAMTALGRLDGISLILPEPSLFLYMYVRKEAVLSSQIEGTQSSLSDLLLFEVAEAPGAPLDDVTEVSCYVSAMYYGMESLETLPLSLRLIKEIHAILMNNARGGTKLPGEFRKSQNWLGGTEPSNAAFVPPPPENLIACLNDLELFLNGDANPVPALIKAALAHVQFETIHPFLDGNGRLGRLLITFILCAEGVMKEPLLYLSLYFKANRQAYYEQLQNVRFTGDWESWVEFFLNGVIDTANQATETATAMRDLFMEDRLLIENSGRSTASALSIHAYLQSNPITNTTDLKTNLNLSLPTILRSLNTLEALGIVKELTGKERHKLFAYDNYLRLLSEGTEPQRN